MTVSRTTESEYAVLTDGDLTDEDDPSTVEDDLVLTTGNSDAGTYSATIFNEVPEPATAVLLGLGGVLIAIRRRRRS